MAAKGPYDHLALVIEIDKKYGVIVNAQASLITDVANNFVHDIMMGFCLENGVDELISEVIATYHGAAKNALIAALKDLYREYNKYRGM